MNKLLLFFAVITGISAYATEKPNIVLILADDLGYSDSGCFGGEIPTPNLDSLAQKGLRLTQFYNVSKSCPSRASLMTGLFQHQTGIGHLTERPESITDRDWGTEGYRGKLNDKCVTIAEALKPGGYHNYIVGKWHLGYHEDKSKPLQ